MRVLAGLLAAAALVLLLPTTVRLPDDSGTRLVDRLRHPQVGAGLTALTICAVTTLVAVVDGVHLVLTMIVLACLAGAAELVRRSRCARAAERRQRLVVEVCEAMVGELRAGQPLLRSLEHSVEVWPDMDTVLAAGRLGADVPTSLRRLARLPGAEGLVHVAAAWQVSQDSGAGLATVLTQVARTARERESTRHLVRGELASAQATARLVAVLPLGSLAMSAGIGGDPWHFLLDTAVGLACLGAGCACAFAGLVWIDRIAANVLRG